MPTSYPNKHSPRKMGSSSQMPSPKARMRGGATRNKATAGSPAVSTAYQFEYIGADGNKSLALKLGAGETIIADGNAMSYMDANIEMKTKMGGLGKAVGRFLSGEDLFLNHYKGTAADAPQRVVFSTPYPGDIIEIPIKKGETWKLSRGSFLVGSEGMDISGKLNLKGIIPFGSDEGLFLTKVTSKDRDGTVWVASYGQIEKHELAGGQAMLVDNENFLACSENVSYTISKVGGFKSLIFGGEGLAMKFSGPCTLYTQTKGLAGLANALAPYIVNKN